jgi:hypothetical protein
MKPLSPSINNNNNMINSGDYIHAIINFSA